MRITIKIDTNACILAANCVGVLPKVFQIGDEPYVEVLNATGTVQGTEITLDASSEDAELLHEAADSCPTRAILLTEHS